MQVGIYASYDRGVATAGAVRVANAVQALRLSVNYVATGAKAKDLHPYWDQKILSTKKSNMRRWATTSSACIWFEPRAHLYAGAFEGITSRKHIFVPSWHTVTREDLKTVKRYSRIVCSSREMAGAMSDVLGTAGQHLQYGIEHVDWTSGIGSMRRPELCTPERLRVFVPVDAYTIKHHGADLLAVVEALLSAHSHLDLTLAIPGTASRLFSGRIKNMKTRYPQRLQSHCKLSADTRLSMMYGHDWTWIPDVRSDNGLPAQESIACGVPVIAWDICPFNVAIKHNWTGQLVPCEYKHRWTGAPIATWSSGNIIRALNDVLQNELPLEQLKSRKWPIRDAEERFRNFWRTVLEI